MDTSALSKAIFDAVARIHDPQLGTELQTLINLLLTELKQLQAENKQLRDAASDRVNPDDYKLEKNAYRKDEKAYCVRCMENDRKARTLIQTDEYSAQAFCPTCKSRFPDVFSHKPIPAPTVVHFERPPNPFDGL